MKPIRPLCAALAALIALLTAAVPAPAEAAETRTVRLLATSDLHGKLLPWDYALNAESPSGSMAQLATAVAAYRNENTLLMDAGDTLQGNSAGLFIGGGDAHPMVQAINALGYDVWVTGNHDYNHGMDALRQAIADLRPKVLVGNVYGEDGAPLADGSAVFGVNGLRVAVIGMVTPNIARWDAVNLAQCTVTDPLEETRRCIDALDGQYDLLVGVFHMDIENEYGVPNSGVRDILKACPEFDVMVASHGHALIEGMFINGALVVENRNQAQTMAVIDVTLARDGEGWRVVDRAAQSVNVGDYAPDPAIEKLLSPYDAMARAHAERVIGRLEGEALVPDVPGGDVICTAQVMDTALVDLINEAQMHYTGATVSSAGVFSSDANLLPGEIRACDLASIYKYDNTLCLLRMNGAQLKAFMEWSAQYYNQYRPGDLTVSFNANVRTYNYDMFAGVNYEIDISKPAGERIARLTWPDGTPVAPDDVFEIAVNNYRATTVLLTPGEIYAEDGALPELMEMDVHGEIGGIRELIGDYIENVKGGVIDPDADGNWRIVGTDWDEAAHARAMALVESGEVRVPESQDGRTQNTVSITEADLD